MAEVKYDAAAARQTDRSYLNPEITNQRLKTVEAMALRAGEQVLDAGCGTGLLTELIASQLGEQGQVIGVDYSQDMLDMAASRCAPLSNVELQQGSVTSLGFSDNFFDAASCVQTLLYVEDVETALTELHRVLKPRGRVAILETDWRGAVINSPDAAMTRRLLEAWDETVSSPNLPTQLIPMMHKAGFSSIRAQAIPILNPYYNENSFGASILPYLTKNAVKSDAITQQEADQWLGEMKQIIEAKAFFFCVNRFLFVGVG